MQARGVTFGSVRTGESRQQLLSQLKPGDPVLLVHEPDNQYDPQAVQVVSMQVCPSVSVHHRGCCIFEY